MNQAAIRMVANAILSTGYFNMASPSACIGGHVEQVFGCVRTYDGHELIAQSTARQFEIDPKAAYKLCYPILDTWPEGFFPAGECPLLATKRHAAALLFAIADGEVVFETDTQRWVRAA